jgi:transposase
LNGHATQSEIVRAFGHSVRTQRDWETQYQKEGLRGLQRKTGSGRRSQIQTSQDVLLRKWFQQGVTQKVMAERLGVGINVVKRALARLGLRRGKTTTQTAIDWNEETNTTTADASEESHCQPAEPADDQSGDADGQHELPCEQGTSENSARRRLDAPAASEASASKPVSVTVGGGPVVIGKVEVVRVPVSTLTHPCVSNGEGAHSEDATEVDRANQAPVAEQVARGFTIDHDPTDRSGDRALARVGLLEDALPLFAEADQLPRAGVLLAIPLLAKNGLLEAFDKIYSRSLGSSFYGLRTLVVTLFLCALLRIKRPENLKEYAPWELGRLLGLDRAPEVKTVRRKLSRLAKTNRAKSLMEEVARLRIAEDENRVAFLYLDGHVREYHGKHPLSKAKKSQRQVAQRAATDTWVHDALGEPLLVVTSELNEGLTQVLEPILAEVRPLVGERRITVIFDRGGYSPKLFARLIQLGFDIITYRKGKSAERPRGEFEEQTLEVDGRCYTYELCDRAKVRIGRLRNKRKKESRTLGPQFLWMREVRVLRGDGRQTPILTNRADLPGAAVAYRAFDRWRQENYFKYASDEFALDALVEYAVQDVSSEADRPNPERKRVQKELSKARGEVSRLQAELGEAAKSSRTRTMRGFKISQAALRRQLESAEARVESLKAEQSELPTRVSASELKTFTTEKKLIVDTIKMTAYQVETELLGMLQGSYARAHQEGRTLLHALFQTAGRVELDEQHLLITLNPQSSPHRTCVISRLCDELNQLETCFPGTHLRLKFAVDDQETGRNVAA